MISKKVEVTYGSLTSLGMNEAEIADQLEWFIDKSVLLVLCEEPSTYEFGVAQPTNKAVLSALLRNILNSRNSILKLQRTGKRMQEGIRSSSLMTGPNYMHNGNQRKSLQANSLREQT